MLAVADIAAGVAFYARLGFEEIHRDDDTAVLERDAVTLHLWRCAERAIADNTACRMQVQGIDALHAECRAADAVHPNGPLAAKPWGTREFTVLDPQGGAITFFERVAA